MLKTLVILPDGTQLTSGNGTGSAIKSCTLTECVNSAQDLTLGSCCANMAELTLFAPAGDVQINAGDELEIYRLPETGQRCKVGIFIAEKPVRRTANTLQVTAYDRVTRLDKDLSQWLAALDGWPYSLLQLAQLVAGACGLALRNTELPNGEFLVQRFTGEGITGRRLIQWIGQAAGRFCRATVHGELEFAWYAPAQRVKIAPAMLPQQVQFSEGELHLQAEDLTAAYDGGNVTLSCPRLSGTYDGQGNVTLNLQPGVETLPFFQNGLSFEDYEVSVIQKVQLRQGQEDVGTVYPDGIADAVNTYVIRDNPLLSTRTAQELVPVARTLYEILKDVHYTPCKVALPADPRIHAGNTVEITDRCGRRITAYVMTKTQKGQKDILECTGNLHLETTTAFHNRQQADLQGRILKLRTDVDGLAVEHTDQAGKLTKLEADLQGIRGQVSSQSAQMGNMQQQMTQVSQTAQALQLTVERIRTDGTERVKTAMGYTFDDRGLQIAKEGQQMKNLLDNTGMYVTRSGQTVLQANDAGVVAADVQVDNYLVVGKHARFEDYSDGADSQRTACFWVQEV